MDWEFWWRVSEHFEFRYVDETLALQQFHERAKTVVDRERTFLEREKVFGPLRKLVPGRSRAGMEWDKRRTVGSRYLESAYNLALRDRASCSRHLRLAACENPLLMAHPTWLGALARVAGGRAADSLINKARSLLTSSK